jgi:hypothetical protein
MDDNQQAGHKRTAEELSMSFQLKRIVFFFCSLYFGLGCCLDNRANAQTDLLFYIFIANISNEFGYREVS